MSEQSNSRALEVLRRATLTRYEHGGGRLYVEGDRHANYCTRELVADFYNEDTRELIMSLIEARLRSDKGLVEQLAIQTRLATDRNRVIGEMGQEIEGLKVALQGAATMLEQWASECSECDYGEGATGKDQDGGACEDCAPIREAVRAAKDASK